MFTRIRTIKGRRYRYLERRWREGGRVRSRSLCLGPVDGGAQVAAPRRRRKGPLTALAELIAANSLSPEERGRVVDETALLREAKAADAAREEMRADFEAATGMRLGPANPVPIEKVSATVAAVPGAAAPAAETATESPAGDAAGQGSEASE